MAFLFTSRAKLVEIFFESIPQLLTQLVMTSAKGEEGVRQLTPLQMASVMTSAINITLGISKYVVDGRKEFLSRQHGVLTSRLVLILVLASEIAFCGGICRFSFAFYCFRSRIPLSAKLRTIFVSSAQTRDLDLHRRDHQLRRVF